jgi:hypothetical protein
MATRSRRRSARQRRTATLHLYRFAFHTAFGVATGEPYGATHGRFDP